MSRIALIPGLALLTALLLTACSEPQQVETPPRPALVIQPQPASAQVATRSQRGHAASTSGSSGSSAT